LSSNYLEKLFGFNGQVAVVIGGTGVLCGEMAEGLASAGAHVVVAGRSEERGAAQERPLLPLSTRRARRRFKSFAIKC